MPYHKVIRVDPTWQAMTLIRGSLGLGRVMHERNMLPEFNVETVNGRCQRTKRQMACPIGVIVSET